MYCEVSLKLLTNASTNCPNSLNPHFLERVVFSGNFLPVNAAAWVSRMSSSSVVSCLSVFGLLPVEADGAKNWDQVGSIFNDRCCFCDET